jgi:hypothetical protein
MPAHDYHFVTHWRVEATPEQVWDVLDKPLDVPRWWPAVYLQVTERRHPHGFSLEAWGDFNGSGTWTFAPDGPFADIAYDWRIRADKPLLRYLSFLFKPFFSANHRWAMARGEESLRLELARRREAD